jgi:hypothetical protein
MQSIMPAMIVQMYQGSGYGFRDTRKHNFFQILGPGLLLLPTPYTIHPCSVSDPGWLSRIPNPTFSIQDPGLQDPGSRSASKNLSIFKQKKTDTKCPGSVFFSIPDPGVKKALDSRHCILAFWTKRHSRQCFGYGSRYFAASGTGIQALLIRIQTKIYEEIVY